MCENIELNHLQTNVSFQLTATYFKQSILKVNCFSWTEDPRNITQWYASGEKNFLH